MKCRKNIFSVDLKNDRLNDNGRLNDNRINTEHIMNAANPFTRRRFIGITAAVAAVAAEPWEPRSLASLTAAAEGNAPVKSRGIPLSAD